MVEHLKEYVKKEVKNRFVLIEKHNDIISAFLNDLKRHGWEDIIYIDKYIILLSNHKTKQIAMLGYLIKSEENKDFLYPLTDFTIFSDYTLNDIKKYVIINILVEVSYSESTKNFKVPDFINWYISSVNICESSIIKTRKFIKKFYNDNFINSEARKINKENEDFKQKIKEKLTNLTNSFYQNSIDNFFNEEQK